MTAAILRFAAGLCADGLCADESAKLLQRDKSIFQDAAVEYSGEAVEDDASRGLLLAQLQEGLAQVDRNREVEARELCTIGKFMHDAAAAQLKMIDGLPSALHGTAWMKDFRKVWVNLQGQASKVRSSAFRMSPSKSSKDDALDEKIANANKAVDVSLKKYDEYLIEMDKWTKDMKASSSHFTLVGIAANWAGMNDLMDKWSNKCLQGEEATSQALKTNEGAGLLLSLPKPSLLELKGEARTAALSIQELQRLQQTLAGTQDALSQEQVWLQYMGSFVSSDCGRVSTSLNQLPSWLAPTASQMVNECTSTFGEFAQGPQKKAKDWCLEEDSQ